ncbi:hypothetical protein LIER_41769 [Lithospermum erythrorhizon]|uniref:Uncharacterized protein n=1 Tax=Lithospermum erythrorhizon TaxID=34254 RepID=A0AAV3RFX0_LITER
MDIDQDRSYSASDPLAIQKTEDKEMRQRKNFSIPFVPLIIKLISFQADIIYNCIIALLSPFLSISSPASESFPQVEDTKRNVESSYMHQGGIAVSGNNNIISILVRKIGLGFLSAAYVCMVLVFLMIMAVILGAGLVRLFVEEPVFMREELSFDYSKVHPTASFLPRGGDGGGFVPVGHTIYVSLLLLIPESDYNINVGVFQVSSDELFFIKPISTCTNLSLPICLSICC